MSRCPWYCTVGLLLVLAAFSWWVWPTPWRHFSYRAVPVRQHRVSGRTEFYEPVDRAQMAVFVARAWGLGQ